VGGQLLAFLGVSLMVIVIPGPDTALTVRNALALRVAGAAYLVALGIQSLWKALWTTRHPQSAVGLPSRLGPLHRRVAVRRARERRARVRRREPASGAGGSGADQGRGG
jgi:threonine/homoserine/homoserine lactone efflux protein